MSKTSDHYSTITLATALEIADRFNLPELECLEIAQSVILSELKFQVGTSKVEKLLK
jgi:hypothetical protein